MRCGILVCTWVMPALMASRPVRLDPGGRVVWASGKGMSSRMRGGLGILHAGNVCWDSASCAAPRWNKDARAGAHAEVVPSQARCPQRDAAINAYICAEERIAAGLGTDSKRFTDSGNVQPQAPQQRPSIAWEALIVHGNDYTVCFWCVDGLIICQFTAATSHYHIASCTHLLMK